MPNVLLCHHFCKDESTIRPLSTWKWLMRIRKPFVDVESSVTNDIYNFDNREVWEVSYPKTRLKIKIKSKFGSKWQWQWLIKLVLRDGGKLPHWNSLRRIYMKEKTLEPPRIEVTHGLFSMTITCSCLLMWARTFMRFALALPLCRWTHDKIAKRVCWLILFVLI